MLRNRWRTLWECTDFYWDHIYAPWEKQRKMLIRGENTVCFAWSLLIVSKRPCGLGVCIKPLAPVFNEVYALLKVLWALYYLIVVPFMGLMVDIFPVVILVPWFPVIFASSHIRQSWVCGPPLAILHSVALTTGYSWLEERRTHISIRAPFPDCGHSWLIKRWAFDPSLASSFPRNFRLGLREVCPSLDGIDVWLLFVDASFCHMPHSVMEANDADAQ